MNALKVRAQSSVQGDAYGERTNSLASRNKLAPASKGYGALLDINQFGSGAAAATGDQKYANRTSAMQSFKVKQQKLISEK